MGEIEVGERKKRNYEIRMAVDVGVWFGGAADIPFGAVVSAARVYLKWEGRATSFSG